MSFLKKLFPQKSTSPAAPSSSAPPSPKTAAPSPLRLADPKHPARKELDILAQKMDERINVLGAGAVQMSIGLSEIQEPVQQIDAVIAKYPQDLDLLLAKACILYSGGQFQSAEEVVDLVLSKDPKHFEARTWKDHWDTWANAAKYPSWSEQKTALHPLMIEHFQQARSVQLVRDGLQKAVAVVASIQGPPLHPQTQFKVEWVLSKTPHGPLVALYQQILEPGCDPSTMEAFVSIFSPKYNAMEGYNLMRQLAFAPYYFGIMVQNGRVVFNHRITMIPRSAQNAREIAAYLEAQSTFMSEGDFQRASQWHMNSFDMNSVKFD